MNTNTKQVEKFSTAVLVNAVYQQGVIDAFKRHVEKTGTFHMHQDEKDGTIFCTSFNKPGTLSQDAGILIQPNRCYDADDCKALGLDGSLPGVRWTPFAPRLRGCNSVRIGELLVPYVGEAVAKLLGNPTTVTSYVSRTSVAPATARGQHGMFERVTTLIWYTDQGSELTIQLHDLVYAPSKYKPGKF